MIAAGVRRIGVAAAVARVRHAMHARAIGGERARAADAVLFARLGGVVLACALDIFQQRPGWFAVVAGIAGAHALARAVKPARGSAGVWLDVAIAVAVLAVTGGVQSNHVLYALAACVAAGLEAGLLPGVTAGAVVAAGSLQSVDAIVVADRRMYVAWFALFPVVGAGGAILGRLFDEAAKGERLLDETNRTLASLYRLARRSPAGLEVGGVASEVLTSVASSVRPRAAVFLFADEVGMSVAGAFGVASGERLETDELVDLLDEPAHVFDLPGSVFSGCWLSVPVVREGDPLALVLVACDRHHHERDLATLSRIADGAALAVENALLFRAIRELAVDEERNRIARDLHDGVAQALTHLRFELDHVSRSDLPEAMRDHVERLGRVTQRASVEVRAAIRGLRAGLPGGLAAALSAHVAELRGPGMPELRLHADGVLATAPAVETEAFRVAQEAIANAVKHARASRVDVTLEAVGDGFRLVVVDDGDGLGPAREEGVGLHAMRERAERIGATIAVGAAPGGGTRVCLEVGLRKRSIA